MKITELEQQTQDFDWFAIDNEGFIAHFAIGGHGKLPQTIAESREGLNQLTRFLLEDSPPLTTATLNRGSLGLVRLPPGAAAEQTYFRHFIEAAERGLYSYDAFMDTIRPTSYFRVAAPLRAVNVTELPLEIADILHRTRLDVIFRSLELVDLDQLS